MARFKPGQSGNPAGRRKGCKDKRSIMREMLKPHAPELVAKAVELAMAGDTAALRLCIERLIPPVKAQDEPVRIPLPKDGTLTEQAQAVIKAAAGSSITPREASAMLAALASQAKIAEVDELTKRIENLEAQRER